MVADKQTMCVAGGRDRPAISTSFTGAAGLGAARSLVVHSLQRQLDRQGFKGLPTPAAWWKVAMLEIPLLRRRCTRR